MIKTIYEIDADIASCIREEIDPETGEILEVVVDSEKLNKFEMEREQKLEGVALWYKETLAMADALKKEKANIDKRKKQAENLAESLREYLSFHLEGKPFETPKVKMSYRSSEQVVIDDIDFIPEKYLKVADPTPDKNALKKAIKNGDKIAGCHLESKRNLNIK